jgi:hypothetical protein
MVISIIVLSINSLKNIPGNDIDTVSLDAGPTGLLDLSSGFVEIIGSDFSTPVGFDGLLDLTVGTCTKMNDNASKTPPRHIPIRGKPRTLERTILKDVGVGKGKERFYGTEAPLRF